MLRAGVLGGVGVFLVAGALNAAIQIDGFTPAANDRFADDAANFIGADYDWSGVGRTTSSRWGTLVSPNVYVSANHYHPAVGSTFEFYPGNDPGALPVTRTVASGQRIGTSDLWVGVLDAPVPGSIATYGFSSEPIADSADFLGSEIAGQNAWMWGLSPSAYPSTTNMALGRNVLDQWYDHEIVPDDKLGDDAVMAVRNVTGDPNYVQYEAYLISGDSGGPMFAQDGSGNLLLAGINWFNGTMNENTPEERNISGFSYTGNYETEIQTYIDANAVPETGGALVGMMLVVVVVFRRGRRTAGLPLSSVRPGGCARPSTRRGGVWRR